MAAIDYKTLNAAKRYIEDSLAGAGALLGIGVSKVEIDSNNHLIVTFSKALPDGSITQDAGALPSAKKYTETISNPSRVWTIQHNLATNWNELTIIPVSSEGNYLIGEVDTDNSTNNLLVLKFDKPFSGKITLK